jgi:hypothetical protein
MSSNHALLSLALAALAGAAQAQSPTVLLRVGDPVPGAGKISDIEAIEVNPAGRWMAIVHTDDPVAHTVLYTSYGPFTQVGNSPTMLGGASIAALDAPTWDMFEVPTYIARLSGGSAAQAVMFSHSVQFLTGQSATYYTAQLPTGSIWRRFDELHFSFDAGGYLLRGAIDDPLAGAFDRSVAAVAWHAGSIGALGDVDVVALEGELAPGLARAIDQVRSSSGSARLSRHSDRVLWSCELDGPIGDDSCVYLSVFWPAASSTLIAREGSPSPVAGRAWGALEDHALDIDSLGSWTLRGQLDDSDLSNDEVLVRDQAVIAREGDVLPAIAPHALTSLGLGRGALDELGRVLWFGAWDDPGTPGADEALFLNRTALLRTGQTAVAGSVLADLDAHPRSTSYDAQHGRFVAFVGSLADGTRGAFLLDRAVVEVYCTAKTNSFGVAPQIAWNGQLPSASLGSGFKITATSLVAKVTALFFYGLDGPLAQPFHGGTLCVQPPLKRALVKNSLGTSGATGFATMDFNSWITSGVDPELVAGARVYVQVWYRDPGFPPPDDVGLTAGLQFRIEP